MFFGKSKDPRARRSRWFNRSRLAVEALEDRYLLATCLWSGAGLDANWTNSSNWGGAAPVAGDDLVFTSGALQQANVNDFAAGTVFNSITFQGAGYSISGNAVTLASGILASNTTGTNTLNLDVTLGASQTLASSNAGATLNLGGAINLNGFTLTVDGSGSSNLTGVASGTSGLVKNGAGTLMLSGNNTYSGNTTVNAGTLLIDGSQTASPVIINTGGMLGGTGTAGAVTLAGGQMSLGAQPSSPGIENTTGNVAFSASSTYSVNLNGTVAGTGYDQLNVTGTVDLGGSTLSASLGYTPNTGDSYTIIHTSGGLTGTFNNLPNGTIFSVSGKSFQISYSATDVVLTQVQTGTTTTLASSLTPSVCGQAVTFTATVNAAPGMGTPTGMVMFTIDGNTQQGVTLVNGQATFTTSTLTAGSHTVTASYSGDANFSGSYSATLTQTVNPIATATTLSSSLSPATYGQAVTFTASVSGSGAGAPTGMVMFSIDGVTQPGVALVNGQASFTTSTLSAGSHTVTASYSGDSNYSGSASAALSQTVNPGSTTTALSSSASPSAFGQSVSFTATVSASGPGAPMGSVTFKDGATTLGTAALSGGTATFLASALTVGSHSITASYSGDANFSGSVSAALAQTVSQASSTTTVTSSANPATSGQAVTFIATVGPSGAGTPTGSVTFQDGTTALGTVALTGGSASFTTSSLAVGEHWITAVYSGDANFTGSTSAALSQAINSTGNAWPHQQVVTLSFVPDGTNLGGYQSNLFATFNSKFGSPTVWQNQILKAAQQWAQQANVNLAVVNDNGAAMGLGNYQQGDPGFGDIRIGGYNFGTTTLAQAYMPPPVNNYSIAGDIQFNTGRTWNIGTTYDLYTVAMHEIGHALGLYHSSTSGAVMYASYQGVKAGLTSTDISAIDGVYGSRIQDVYDTYSSNGSFATATNVTSLINPGTLTALVNNVDLTTTTDADYYTFLAPAATNGTLTVTVQSQGLSLLSPQFTVYAADQTTVLGSASGAGQYGANLAVTLNGVTAGQRFYVKVTGAETGTGAWQAFNTGAYALTLDFGSNPSPVVTLPQTLMVNGNPIQGGGGQAMKVALETQDNTCVLGTQATETPQTVAMDANGNYVVVWRSDGQDGSLGGIYAQRFNAQGVPQGLEFRVNDGTYGDQKTPAVAMTANGNFVVTWSTKTGADYGVRARVFNAAGVALTGDIQVNQYTPNDQDFSSVAVDGNGNFVVTWSSYGEDGDGWGIYARRFSATGAALSDEFRVNSTTSGNQQYSQVAMDANGDFVVTWSDDNCGASWGVRAQRYNAAGVAQGGQMQVNTYTPGDQMYSSAAMDGSGNFVITWSSNGQDGSGWGIYGQRFAADGTALGSEFQINDVTAGDQEWSSVAMDTNGNFLVTWSSYGQDGNGWGVFARQYSGAGSAVGSSFQVNTTTAGDQLHSAVAMNSNGNAVMAWSGAGLLDSSGVFSQQYLLGAANGLSSMVAGGQGDEDGDLGAPGHEYRHGYGVDPAFLAAQAAQSLAAADAGEAGSAPATPQGLAPAAAPSFSPALAALLSTFASSPSGATGAAAGGLSDLSSRWQLPTAAQATEEVFAALPAATFGNTAEALTQASSATALVGSECDACFGDMSWLQDALANPG